MVSRSDRLVVALFGFGLAALLLWTAVPAGLAVVSGVSGDRTMAQFTRIGPRPSDEALRLAAAGRERGLERFDLSDYHIDLSNVLFGLWHYPPPERRDATLLRPAARALERAVLARPLHAQSWWRAAEAAAALDGHPTRRSADFLLTSIDVQPNAMLLLPFRLKTLIDHWTLLAPEEQQRVAGQFAVTVAAFPDRVARIARDVRPRVLIRAMLARDPVALAGFEAALARDLKSRTRR